MTVTELVTRLQKLFPRHTTQIEAWEDEYRGALNRHQGPVLANAYAAVMNGWGVDVKAAFPRPADLAAKCRGEVRDRSDGGPTGKERAEYLAEHLLETTVKCAADARRRSDAEHGPEVTGAASVWISLRAHQIANRYVQCRFLMDSPRSRFHQNEQVMNGARWKFTDEEIATLPSRAAALMVTAGNAALGSLRRAG